MSLEGAGSSKFRLNSGLAAGYVAPGAAGTRLAAIWIPGEAGSNTTVLSPKSIRDVWVFGNFVPVASDPFIHVLPPFPPFEMSTISDFNGTIGAAEIQGTARGSDGTAAF